MGLNGTAPPVAAREFVVETIDLTKRFGDVVAVDTLSLRVPRGGVFGFLGPNGSGKTTTMGMLLGLVHPTSGEARIFGDPARHPATLRRVGAMVETPTFYPYLSGRANLKYFQGIRRRGSPADIDRLLQLVDLGKRADTKFSTYSLGMKQRLASRSASSSASLAPADGPSCSQATCSPRPSSSATTSPSSRAGSSSRRGPSRSCCESTIRCA